MMVVDPEAMISQQRRPRPPEHLIAGLHDLDPPCEPSPEMEAWLRAAFIDDDAPLFHGEHLHLQQVKIGVVWCATPLRHHMLAVVRQAEIPQARGNRWARAGHDQQLVEWFGEPSILKRGDPKSSFSWPQCCSSCSTSAQKARSEAAAA